MCGGRAPNPGALPPPCLQLHHPLEQPQCLLLCLRLLRAGGCLLRRPLPTPGPPPGLGSGSHVSRILGFLLKARTPQTCDALNARSGVRQAVKPALPAHPAIQDARNGALRYQDTPRPRNARVLMKSCARCGGAFSPDVDGIARCLLCGRSRPPAPAVRCSAECQSCAWLERHSLPRGAAVQCEHEEFHCRHAHINAVLRKAYWTLQGRRGTVYAAMPGVLCSSRACETCAHRKGIGMDRAPAVACKCSRYSRPHCDHEHRRHRAVVNMREREQRAAASLA